MPFTPSHMAAALPFIGTPLVPAAVVMGTMAPDLPYYLPLFVPRELSHSLLGLVTVDPLMGVIAVAVWWFFLREPVIDSLPRWVGSRISTLAPLAWRPSACGRPRTAAVVVLSVLVGVATHLLWDSFTHPGWVVDHVGLLRVRLGPLPLEKWLQHASSVAGLVIVAIWSLRRLRRFTPNLERPTRFTTPQRIIAWALVVIAGIVGGLVPWVHGMLSGVSPFDPNLVFLVARLGIASGAAAALIVILMWYLLLPRHPLTASR